MQNDFLQFLRYCLSLDDQPLPDCAIHINWTELLRFAKKQSIVGVCWQGVKRIFELSPWASDADVKLYVKLVNMVLKKHPRTKLYAQYDILKGLTEKDERKNSFTV